MDTLAPPVMLLFRRRSTLEQLVLDPALEIGAGGEAVVYEVPGNGSLVAKVYHQATIERARKLTLMLANPPRMPAGTAIAWPADLLMGPRGFAGFVMPMAQGPRLFEFYNPVSRRSTAPAFHWGLLHRAGRHLAAAFDALHAAGYVVGDVNESNILVHPRTAAVTLVDADSLQVPDAENGATFRSRVGKAEFTPPELQGVSFTDVDRSPEHDRFGLAVLLFLALMEGTHPFAMRMPDGADALPVEDRIRGGLFPHASEDDDILPPRMSPRFGTLHPALRALFIRCFVQGHADPSARPTAAEWGEALAQAEAALAECAANPLHRHDASQAACPWCDRAAQLGGRDPFPRDAPATGSAALPQPRRARMAGALAYASPASGLQIPTHAAQLQPMPLATPAAIGPQGPPVPAVFGPQGLRNPLVYLLPAIALWVMLSGPVSFFGFVVGCVSLYQLLKEGWKNVTATTVVLGVCAMLFLGALAGLSASAEPSYGDPPVTLPAPPDPYLDEGPPVDLPSGGVASNPPSVKSITDLKLADLHAAPADGVADPGAQPPAGVPGTLVSGYDVDRLPSLENAEEAARTLAWFYPTAPEGREAGHAMFWLHVAADGRVTATGRQLVRSSSRDAADAAVAVVPYLRYSPAIKDGKAVDVWIAQQMVIEP